MGNLALAFLGGLLSFFSPCFFPLIPSYLILITGVSIDEFKSGGKSGIVLSGLFKSLFFILGFSIAFTSLGVSASFIGTVLKSFKKEFSIAAGIILLFLGLHLTGILKIPFLTREFRMKLGETEKFPREFIIFLLGFFFAFGWSPCIGPILAGILTLAASEETLLEGAVLLFVFSIGLGVPFLISSVFIAQFLSLFAKVKKHLRAFELVSGILLILIAILFITQRISVLNSFSISISPIEDFLMSKKKLYHAAQSAKVPNLEEIVPNLLKADPINGLMPSYGDFMIVNFFSIYCPPCKKELVDFNQMIKKYPQLTIIGIAYSDAEVSEILKFLEKEIKVSFPVFMLSDIGFDYDPDGLPETLFFHKGKFIGKILGIVDEEEIIAFLNEDFSMFTECKLD